MVPVNHLTNTDHINAHTQIHSFSKAELGSGSNYKPKHSDNILYLLRSADNIHPYSMEKYRRVKKGFN